MDHPPADHLARARESYAALQRFFYQPSTRLYHERYPPAGGPRFAYLWPFSQALAATIDLWQTPGAGDAYADEVLDRLDGLERYWNARSRPPGYDSAVRPPLGPGGDQYYDDNEWVGLELIRLHARFPSGWTLERSRQIFALVTNGWADDPSLPAPGGVRWVRAQWNRDRNTVSTAPAAILALRLLEATGEREYLAWAERMVGWVERWLRGPDGLYWDHIDERGGVDRAVRSYNQGSMIGARVLLARATGEMRHLREAEAVARGALERFRFAEEPGAQPPAFNAVFFRNLLLLDAAAPDARYRASLAAYADAMRARFLDERTGLYRLDSTGPTSLLDQAAMVRVHAALATPSAA